MLPSLPPSSNSCLSFSSAFLCCSAISSISIRLFLKETSWCLNASINELTKFTNDCCQDSLSLWENDEVSYGCIVDSKCPFILLLLIITTISIIAISNIISTIMINIIVITKHQGACCWQVKIARQATFLAFLSQVLPADSLHSRASGCVAAFERSWFRVYKIYTVRPIWTLQSDWLADTYYHYHDSAKSNYVAELQMSSDNSVAS